MIARPESIQEVLFNALRALGATRGYHSARLEGELLLAHVLGITRAQLLARLGEPIEPQVAGQFAGMVARRGQGEPLAYILGHKEFYGLDLIVDRRVMIPRPETEHLVERALEILEHATWLSPTIVDVGTGSGAIAISIGARVQRGHLVATDISREALEVARVNAQRLGLLQRIHFTESDLLDRIEGPIDLLLANLPYIPAARENELPREVRRFEPRVALIGGLDGLRLVRQLLQQARVKLRRGSYLLFEISEEQGEAARALVSEQFPFSEMQVHKDLENLDRVVELRL